MPDRVERPLPRRVADAGYRAAFRIAYNVLKCWWFVARPRHDGVLIGVWHGQSVLLVRNSYRKCMVLPGGGVRSHESAAEAAARELAEEVGLSFAADQMWYACSVSHAAEYRRDELPFYEVTVDQPVEVRIDHREVVWADFVAVREALKMNLYEPVREYLENRSHASEEDSSVS